MNFIFAIVVFIGLYSLVGLPSAETLRRIESVVRGSPAAKAGIAAGDEITAVDGHPTKDTLAISEAIRKSDGKSVTVTLQRSGQTLNKTLIPEWQRPLLGGDEKVPMIGVQFATGPTTYQKVSLPQAVALGFGTTFFITSQIKDTVVRALTGRLSRMEREGIGGPVRIAQEVGNSAREGWIRTLQLTAALSVNLGLLNLLPIPALDGGRILFLVYELVMRRPLDPRKEGIVHAVGMAMLLAFMLFITVRDILPMLGTIG
jgi:regulator of sigma E protease